MILIDTPCLISKYVSIIFKITVELVYSSYVIRDHSQRAYNVQQVKMLSFSKCFQFDLVSPIISTRFLFIRKHFIRNLHVEGRNILRILILTRKITKELSISKLFITVNSRELGSRFHSFAATTLNDPVSTLLSYCIFVFGLEF